MNLPNAYRPSEYSFPALQDIVTAEIALAGTLGPHIYVGGACVGFYIDDLGAAEIRPTDDIDIAVEVASEVERVDLDEKLRQAGLAHDITGPICRWRLNNLILDIMPADSMVLGFSNRWYVDALSTAIQIQVLDVEIKIPDVCTFLATKIEAFNDRGRNDFIGSSDFEDIIRVLDGCTFLAEEGRAASAPVRAFVKDSLFDWMLTRTFQDALAAHLLDAGELGRRQLVHQRIQVLIDLAG
jgi:hypothetical protein